MAELLTQIFSAKTIAEQWTTDPSNMVPYLGEGFFPANKQMDLDLSWIKGHKGLPVSLMPSSFDTKPTYRDRIGVDKITTEMPFFREAYHLSEKDRRDIMRLQSQTDRYAQSILTRVYDDVNNLIAGARVVKERMRFQLLAPIDGNCGINISANGTAYVYNYDPAGAWKASNYTAITTAADKWNAADTCDPLDDLRTAMDAVEQKTGTRPALAIMTLKTFNYVLSSARLKSAVLAQNATANIFLTQEIALQVIQSILGLSIIIYTKKFQNEAGVTSQFMPDDYVTLLPGTPVGETMHSYTPEEVDPQGTQGMSVAVVDTGITVTTVPKHEVPINVDTVVDEIVLPTFPGMDNVSVMKVV